MYEALGQTLADKAFDHGLCGGFAPHECLSVGRLLTPSPERVRMRLLAEKEKGVPDSQPSKSLAMVIRSRVVRCGFHTRLERQQCRMVSRHNGDNFHRRLDTCRSGIDCI